MVDDDMDMPQPEFKDYNEVTEEYASKKTCELLNMIDFEEMLGKARYSVSDIQRKVETEVPYEQKTYDFLIKNENVFEGIVFNWMSEEEFADYLKERYGKDKLNYSEYEVVYREVSFKK